MDAVLGTGLRDAPAGLPAAAIAAILGRFEAGVPVVAVDLPSGLPSDGGAVDWPAARATVTVTFAAPKRGHVLPPACDHVGELVVADIGIGAGSLAAACAVALPARGRGRGRRLPAAPPRRPQGRLRAPAGRGGLGGQDGRGRAGRGRRPAQRVRPRHGGDARALPARRGRGAGRGDDGAAAGDRRGGIAEAALARAAGAGRGARRGGAGPRPRPGPGDARARAGVRAPVPGAPRDRRRRPQRARPGGRRGGGPRRPPPRDSDDPHPAPGRDGAARRPPGARRSRGSGPRRAVGLARETGAIVVLKGERTLVAEPDGPGGDRRDRQPGPGDRRHRRRARRRRRGAARAARGSARPRPPAVVVHGRAGDLAARERGEEGLTAGDVVDALPAAIESLRRGAGGGESAR